MAEWEHGNPIPKNFRKIWGGHENAVEKLALEIAPDLTARIEALEAAQRRFDISVLEQRRDDAFRAAQPTLSPEGIDRLKGDIDAAHSALEAAYNPEKDAFEGLRARKGFAHLEKARQILGMEE